MKISVRMRTLLLAGLLFMLALLSIPGLNIDPDILSILPQQDAQMTRYRQVLQDFNPMNAVYLDLQVQETGGDEQNLAQVSDTLLVMLQESGLFERVMHRWSLGRLTATIDTLRAYQSLLFTKEDSQRVSRMLTADSINRRLQWWKTQLSSSPSPFLVQQMVADPLGMDHLLADKLVGMQAGGQNVQVNDGRLLSADGRHALFIAFPRFAATDSRRAKELVAKIESIQAQLTNRFSTGKPQLAWLSGHRYAVENETRIRTDIQTTVTISLVAIVLLTLFVYHQPLLMLLTLVPALFGSVLALGVLRWLLPQVSAVALGSGAMLIGLAVDYGIHFLYHADRLQLTRNNTSGVRQLQKKLHRPLLLSALTTVMAFTLLLLTDLPGYRQLGLFVGIGIVSALGFVLLVLPQLLPGEQTKMSLMPTMHLAGLFEPFFRFSARHHLLIPVVMSIVTILFIPGMLNTKFDGDLQHMNASSQAMQRDRALVEASLGAGMSGTFIVVHHTKADSAFAQNDRLAGVLSDLRKKKLVTSALSVADIFPGPQQRLQNQNRWQRVFSPQQVQTLQEDLNRTARQNGFRPGIFKAFFNELRPAEKPLSGQIYIGTVLEELWRAQVAQREAYTAILTQARLIQPEALNKVRGALDDSGLDYVLYNGRALAGHTIELIQYEMERMALWVLSAILLLLVVAERRLRDVLALLTPLVVSVTWTFGLMGYLQLPVNIVNSIVIVFVFGLIIDYCFFLKAAAKNSIADMAGSGAAVSLSAVTTMLALGALAFAGHPALQTLGITAFIGIASGLLAALAIIPRFFNVGNKP